MVIPHCHRQMHRVQILHHHTHHTYAEDHTTRDQSIGDHYQTRYLLKKLPIYTSCRCLTCQVCVRVENGLLHCCNGTNYRTRPVLCHTTGCIYALQCLWCSKIYVGQTGRQLHTRINEHIRNIKNGSTSSNFATHMTTHPTPLNFSIFALNYNDSKFDRLLEESCWINQTKAEINNVTDGHYTLSATCLQVHNHYQHSTSCQPIFTALPR